MRRILILSLGLAAAGAVAGAVCGVLALTPILVMGLVHPTPDEVVGLSDFVVMPAEFGALFGVIAGPLLAWSLLRRAPLWRVVLEPTIGTVVGSWVGWAAPHNPWLPGIPTVLLGAGLGAVAGAIALRVRAGRYRGPYPTSLPADKG